MEIQRQREGLRDVRWVRGQRAQCLLQSKVGCPLERRVDYGQKDTAKKKHSCCMSPCSEGACGGYIPPPLLKKANRVTKIVGEMVYFSPGPFLRGIFLTDLPY